MSVGRYLLAIFHSDIHCFAISTTATNFPHARVSLFAGRQNIFVAQKAEILIFFTPRTLVEPEKEIEWHLEMARTKKLLKTHFCLARKIAIQKPN